MAITVYLKSRNGTYEAEGLYSEKKLIVKKGSRISLSFADHIRGGKNSKLYRDNPKYVDENGYVLQDCSFASPSTAAQFVTGCSNNGYRVWKDSNNKCLGDLIR